MQNFNPERIKEARLARGVSRSKLARLAGLTERQVAQFERGQLDKVGIDEAALTKIESALRVRHGTFTKAAPLSSEDFQIDIGPKSCSCC